ncbi:hypothetical protein [Poseidonocella sp. HB161398]|uniref:hypothetical protein n=1 Tax=Poseidonocella sp. HB161398 TaxID=2320855 RepID=UPI001109674D|nr:hypothetical protein [Poseidonocella sp. HB161398]
MERDGIDTASALARAVVGELRPAELLLMPATEAAFWRNGGRLPASSYGRAIGFGTAAEAGAALAPVALVLAAFGLETLRDLAKEKALGAGRALFAAIGTRLAGGKAEPLELPPAEFARLQEGIAAEARKYLSEDVAAALTHAIVSRIAAPAPPGAGPQ